MTISANETTTRAAYAAPTLTVFGAVADLTASGTGASCEHVLGNGTCKFKAGAPGKRP